MSGGFQVRNNGELQITVIVDYRWADVYIQLRRNTMYFRNTYDYACITTELLKRSMASAV